MQCSRKPDKPFTNKKTKGKAGKFRLVLIRARLFSMLKY
ncbi:hypothetical protein NBRC111894_493 [Sporolactobacillus inulinus]|uniref:Uncharacterized protein n=1 Tax=Sporolactobacillus inulinus TaxID=2078 RepID=A0A4Y1Z7D5_9BACL|nr:hypothetical protein NBRC111894_493 [Sporolactobacillus inulinus]